jgi:hypothetical protein
VLSNHVPLEIELAKPMKLVQLERLTYFIVNNPATCRYSRTQSGSLSSSAESLRGVERDTSGKSDVPKGGDEHGRKPSGGIEGRVEGELHEWKEYVPLICAGRMPVSHDELLKH